MKILSLSVIALIGTGLTAGQAFGANFGSLTVNGGETQTVDIGPTARNVRVCNDLSSAGPIVVVIDDNVPRNLSPGICAQDIGDRLTIQSRASGPAVVAFRTMNTLAE